MANGRLGSGVSVANTNISIYTVPATVEFATITICIVNTGTEDATLKLSIGPSMIPELEDYIEYETILPAKAMLERTCMVCSTNEQVIVNSSNNDLAVRIHGLEQPII